MGSVKGISDILDSRFREALQNAGQGFLIHQNFRPVFVNRAFSDLFGYPEPEDILAMDSIMELYAPHERARLTNFGNARMRGEAVPEKYEYQGLRHDGGLVWLENVVSIVDWDGSKAFFNAATDISDRKRTEALLRESERRFRDYAESATDWLWEMDENLRWTYFSGRFEEATGHPPSRFIGKTRREFIEKGDTVYGPMTTRTDWERHLADLDAHRPFRNFRHPRILPDGQIRYVSISGKPVWDEEGSFKGYRGTGANVTDQVVAELALRQREAELRMHRDRAEEANLAKSKFLANVSHELRTPLNAIIGFSDIMSRALLGQQDPDRYRGYAKNIHDSAGQLLKLITDILDITTIQAGEHPFNAEEFDFAAVVNECFGLSSEQSDKRGVVLEADLPPDLTPLIADRGGIRRILLNLLSNAIRYSPAGNSVTVTASATGAWFDFAVVDRGAGIAPSDLSRLTDPFERGRRDPYRSEEGTGLGLTIVRSLVDLHGGKLQIESDLGKGTRVRVSLPRKLSGK
jgi:two-component system cell cycle sensor histidine kinase PleC